MFPKDSCQRRLLKKFYFVRVRNSAPIVTSLECTLWGVNDEFVVSNLCVPLRWKSYQPLQVSLFKLRVKSALVQRIQIMNYVHEFGASKDLITPTFHVSTHESAHPVICDNNWRKDFELAETLQCSKCKVNKLLRNVHCAFSIIGFREEFRVVEPNVVYSIVLSSVNSELVFKLWPWHSDISFVIKTVLCQVVRFFLFVVFVVRCYYIDFFTKPCKLLRKLVNHNSQPTHRTPRTDLRSHKSDGTQNVIWKHVGYCTP